LGEVFSRIIGRRERDMEENKKKEKNGGGSKGGIEKGRNIIPIKEDKKEKKRKEMAS